MWGMRRALVASVSALLLFACGNGGPSHTPDGGEPTDASQDSMDAGLDATGLDAMTVDAPDADAPAPDVVPCAHHDYDHDGPFPVGHTRFVILDRTGQRMLPVEVWYPATEAARAVATAGVGLETLEPEGSPERATLAPLVAAAPASCTRKTVHSAPDADPALPTAGALPLVVFSHCHGCARFSEAVVAERLASFGIAMAAPDHVDNTLYGNTAMIDEAFLQTRASDIASVLDALLDPANASVPASLRGHFDAARVGGMGHSFGAVTMGRVLRDDPRVKAGFIMAAPIDSPVLHGAVPSTVHVPVLFLLAREDNSITELGNQYLRMNFNQANPPVWLVQVADAGHWSFSDLAGMTSGFAPGCGQGTRQTMPGVAFTYLDNDTARGIAQRYAAAFFALHLLGDEDARCNVGEPSPAALVTVSTR